MTIRLKGVMMMAATLAAELASIVVLDRLGADGNLRLDWRNLDDWLARVSPEDALATAARLVALAVAWWLLTTTALYLIACTCRLPCVVRGLSWVTPAWTTRISEGLVGATLVASMSAAISVPAHAVDVVPSLA